jgi:hypothetical protein
MTEPASGAPVWDGNREVLFLAPAVQEIVRRRRNEIKISPKSRQ